VSTTTRASDDALAVRLVTAPGVVRAGMGCWDRGRTPIHPLTLEYAYADPGLLRDLGVHGGRSARRFGVDVVVGAETGGVPLAAAVSLASGVPFAFVRKPGYRGHELDEPPVRGADVRGRKVLLVDDAVSSGASLERFAGELADEGAHLAGAFVLVDMRDVAEAVTPFACSVATESISTYLRVLEVAAAHGILAPLVHELSVDAIVNRWGADDPRWEALIAAV
jgi:orotate phosphoribosyltransferase